MTSMRFGLLFGTSLQPKFQRKLSRRKPQRATHHPVSIQVVDEACHSYNKVIISQRASDWLSLLTIVWQKAVQLIFHSMKVSCGKAIADLILGSLLRLASSELLREEFRLRAASKIHFWGEGGQVMRIPICYCTCKNRYLRCRAVLLLDVCSRVLQWSYRFLDMFREKCFATTVGKHSIPLQVSFKQSKKHCRIARLSLASRHVGCPSWRPFAQAEAAKPIYISSQSTAKRLLLVATDWPLSEFAHVCVQHLWFLSRVFTQILCP